MCLCNLFLSLLFFFCACFFAKAEISWLGTIRGDSECKAECFLFVSDIGALGHTVLWCARASVCFMCSRTPQISLLKYFVSRLFSFQAIIEHCEAALRFLCLWVLEAGHSDPGPQPEHLAESASLLYGDSADHRVLSQTFWITVDNGEIGVNNGLRPGFIRNFPRSSESNYLLRRSHVCGTFPIKHRGQMWSRRHLYIIYSTKIVQKTIITFLLESVWCILQRLVVSSVLHTLTYWHMRLMLITASCVLRSYWWTHQDSFASHLLSCPKHLQYTPAFIPKCILTLRLSVAWSHLKSPSLLKNPHSGAPPGFCWTRTTVERTCKSSASSENSLTIS